MYYLPLKERLYLLLISDLRNLFHYPDLRTKTNKAFYEDVYDGTIWHSFQNQMNVQQNEKFIALQYCWVGTD